MKVIMTFTFCCDNLWKGKFMALEKPGKLWDFSPTLWLGSRVVSVLDSGAEGPGFKSQSRRCRVTVLGKLFAPILPLFTKQQNWYQLS